MQDRASLISAGNRTILQVAEIASKHRMKLFIPPTVYIGAAEYQNAKDHLIYTDPATYKLVVKKIPITIFDVKSFIDKHMNSKDATAALFDIKRRKPKDEGLMAPKYILKILEKHCKGASTRVFFDQNQLIADIIENWGKCDLIVQQFVE